MRHRHDGLVVLLMSHAHWSNAPRGMSRGQWHCAIPRGLLVAAALAVGCQQAPAPPSGATVAAPPAPHVSAAIEAKQEGDAFMARADYRGAIEKYLAAAALDPDDMTIRFALGTARTFVAQRNEAIEDFRVVVKRSDAASVEHREARRWLAAAGLASEPAVQEATSSTPARTDVAPAAPEKIVGGRLVGRMEWPGVDPQKRAVRGELTIQGAEASNQHVKQARPISLGGRYHFYNIPPGQYRIVARLYGTPSDVTLWDQKVMVDDGRPTELVLTPETALLAPDKFPPPPIG